MLKIHIYSYSNTQYATHITDLFYYAYALIIQSSVWITDQAEKDKLISEFKKNTG